MPLTVTLDNLRGLDEILQYNTGAQIILRNSQLVDQLSDRQQAVKKASGVNDAVTSTVILLSGLAVLQLIPILPITSDFYERGLYCHCIDVSSFGPVVAFSCFRHNTDQYVCGRQSRSRYSTRNSWLKT